MAEDRLAGPDKGPRRIAALRAFAVNAAVMLVLGLIGGALFRLAGMPLAWTLGPMTAAAIVAVLGAAWTMPAPIRDVARPVVGVLAGSSFTPGTLAALAAAWPALLFVAGYTILTTGVGWWYFRRLCRLDATTAFFASSPGGLSEMTLLGGLMGGNMRSLVLIHAVRVVIVVFAVPSLLQLVLGHAIARGSLPVVAGGAEPWGWAILIGCGLAGFLAGKAWRFPGGVMIAAMLCSAVVHGAGVTHLAPPGWLVTLVQVVIGTIAGGRFAGVRWRELGRLIYQAVAWAVVLVVASAVTAFLAAGLFHKPFPIFLLALAPGGTTEMSLISYALGIEASFVVICQVGRTFMVSGLMPVACRMFGIGDPSLAASGGAGPRGAP